MTTPERRPRRVLVVDDHALVREGLRELLSKEPDLEVVGEAADAETAIAEVSKTRPDGVVIDLSLGQDMGFSLLTALRELAPEMSILVLSMHDETVFAERALANGADGYVGKHEPTAVFVTALRRVLDGKTYVSEAVAERLLRALSPTRPTANGVTENALGRLTGRELEILRKIGLGRGTREIANELKISTKTVETHRSSIKEKLAVSTGSQLVMVAVHWVRDGFLPASIPRMPRRSSPPTRSPASRRKHA